MAGNYTIPDGVTTIASFAFYDCSNLTGLIIPDSVSTIGTFALLGCESTFEKENGIHYIGKWVVGCDDSITEAVIREGTEHIASQAFSECSALTSVVIPEGVLGIGEWAFGGCVGLTSVTVPASVTVISDFAFSGCASLTSIVVPHGISCLNSNVIFECEALTDIYFTGTEETWNAIMSQSSWYGDEAIAIHYNHIP